MLSQATGKRQAFDLDEILQEMMSTDSRRKALTINERGRKLLLSLNWIQQQKDLKVIMFTNKKRNLLNARRILGVNVMTSLYQSDEFLC